MAGTDNLQNKTLQTKNRERNEKSCEDEEVPVVVPLFARVDPDVVEFTLRIVAVEVEEVAIAVGVQPIVRNTIYFTADLSVN